jgi:glycosyltransferase involved in cell wall biosynthesis
VPERDASRGHHVLAVVKSLQRGGAEILLLEQVRALHARGHQVDVLYDGAHPGPLVDDLRALGSRVVGETSLHRRPGAIRRHARGHCIVHTHAPLPAATVRTALHVGPRRPAIVHTEHNVWPRYHPATAAANRMTFRLVDRAVAVSHVVEASMSDPARRRTQVLHHGIDTETAWERGQAGAGRLRQLLGVAPGTPIVGTIANLKPEKDYPNLLAAAREVLRQRPDTVFVAIGHGHLADEVEDLARRLDVSEAVHLLGARDDALELIADVDVFVLASRFEGLPVALMEAMALARPIVATKAGGVPELVRHGETGLCVPTQSPQELAGALVRLLDDPGQRRRLGTTARHVIQQTSPDAVTDRLLRLYADVCPVHGT